MTILMVNEKAGFFGGVEQFLVRLARGLGTRGHRLLLVYREDTGRNTEEFLSAFVSARRTDTLDSSIWNWAGADIIVVHKWQDSQFLDTLPPEQRSRTCRMLHDYDELCPRRHKYYAWTGTVCRRGAGPLCFFDAGFLEKTNQGLRWKPALAFFRELSRQNSYARIVVASRFMADQAQRNGISSSRITILPPSPPMASLDEGVWQATGTGPTRVLFVGQLIRGKGVDLLLRAVALVPGLWLDVAGTGNAAAALQALTNTLGLEDRVCFHGFVDQAQIDELYRRADIAVVPSRWPEPFGMVGLEAMARKKPVIAFDVGGIPDWLADGETGLLVSPGDPAALAKALSRLAADPQEGRRMGEAGARRRSELFGFDAALEQWEAMFRSMQTQRQP